MKAISIHGLKDSQACILRRVVYHGTLVFNSRMRRPIQALVKRGYVTAFLQVRPDALRGRHTLAYSVTATAHGRSQVGLGKI